MQYGLLVRFSVNRNGEEEYMQHYFNRMKPIVLNEHNIDTTNHIFQQFVDEVTGDQTGGLKEGQDGFWMKFWRLLLMWQGTNR